jgi:GNAT superfamily N-acetyltransferase
MYRELPVAPPPPPSPAPRAAPDAAGAADGSPVESAELHTVLCMLQAMENAWLSLNLDVHYAHPLNRGWMDVFYRWTTSKTFRRYWPVVRSEFARRFVSFCERQMRVGEVRVELRPLQDDSSVPEVLCREFADQWPRPHEGLPERLARARAAKPHPLPCWLIRVGMADSEPAEPACGIILVHPNGGPRPALASRSAGTRPEELVAGEGPEYEFLIWVRGAYRNSGVGKRALDEALRRLRKQWPQPFSLVVRLLNREVTGPGGRLLRRMWLTFFHHHDFRRVYPTGQGAGEVPESGPAPATPKETEILLRRKFPAAGGNGQLDLPNQVPGTRRRCH